MSLKEILEIEREREQRERIIYDTIYERMTNRINNTVRVKSKECIYTIPEFIPGYPLIDTEKTMSFLLDKLKKEGFIVMQLTALDLYITWDPERISELNKITTRQSETLQQKVMKKEFDRENDDFINTLILSKKNERK